MSYLDFLLKGSEVHKCEPTRSKDVHRITPANDSDKCWLAFQRLLDDVHEHTYKGYTVKLGPPNTRRSLSGWYGTVYDMALISTEDMDKF